mmetsp:Transcript_41120/g.96091  ORF Transcript_41120/g.96091 Transcript_41120/m.96091 type:complete len:178 (+) Transcript_41120:158-691(+)|eukprot:CAMPEP_0175973994 /NCGR_PEP_ID=MMETSP0108-20121206/43124_1 /TAXON_ID=195067 ORGANISM="Goniomonas pacifica, Strain CCMP1869" /NCGR_SAMPLE_ID=MMETSP0108 /ASSEMBLY_ACC=CAM_ASM_000204 /LENGTH=177 /DNA_ID=CAMNT_0017303545 /DNA_START=97 /DNA_END=630 /DNA_ORIENTATION=-
MEQAADRFDFAPIRWHPFLLRPDMPLEGVPKPPDTPSNPRVNSRLKAIGESVGIDFTGKCDVRPNSLLAHCLATVADQEGKGDHLQEVLFRNYFTDGVDLCKKENLLRAAHEVGLNMAASAAVLEDMEVRQTVLKEDQKWKSQNIHGVPFFIFNGKTSCSGAQDAKSLIQCMIEASS